MPAASAPRVLVVNAAGDTVARLTGGTQAGINRVSWNFVVGAPEQQIAGGRGGGGGGRGGAQGAPANVPGFPPGFNPRPSESSAAPDSSASPTAQARALAAGGGRGGRGGRGGGGGGGGRGSISTAETGDYKVVLDAGGTKLSQILRVVRVAPGSASVMVP
jgi:hypothetical protein